MDFATLLDEHLSGNGGYLPDHADDTYMQDVDLPMTEDNFLNMLADDEHAEDFGLSLLENNHDLIDIMAPLIATPLSSFTSDDIEVMGNSYTEDPTTYITDNKFTEIQSSDHETTSPLRQLLLSTTSKKKEQHPEQKQKPEILSTPAPRKRPTRAKSKKKQNSKQTQVEPPCLPTVSRASRLPPSQHNERTYDVTSPVADVTSEPKEKHVSKALKFPPCAVCGGNASGLHYGVNSCEACKGFFRRYIIRNEEYKCAKGGNCKVVNKNRENCSGCRLKKCLELGMSKENSKLGRYSLSRRTETIKKVNVLEGKEKLDKLKKANLVKQALLLQPFRFDHTYSGVTHGSQSPRLDDIIADDCAPDSIIEDLVKAMDAMQPYGPNITTREEIQDVMKRHHLKYQSKLEMYGQMKAIPNKEYYKLLKDYGIDIDGRIKVFKEYVMKIKRISARYFNFAMQIPGFKKLDSRDQSKLLNSARCDFFVTLMHEGYKEEYNVLLARNGVPYHIDELADKFFSRKLLNALTKGYRRVQKLELTKEEKALLVALTLVFTDRCKLENREFVDKIQYIVSELLRFQLERTSGVNAAKRFTKFVDCLIYLRDIAEIYWEEYRQLCKDEVIVEQVPMVTEFLVDEW